jgi:hypothetical protein
MENDELNTFNYLIKSVDQRNCNKNIVKQKKFTRENLKIIIDAFSRVLNDRCIKHTV